MKPPDETRNGGPVSETADHTEPTAKSADDFGDGVNAVQLARAYVVAADAEHAAKLARLEARDRLIECAAVGFEFEGVRVQQRNCWKLTAEGAAELAAARATLIEEGKADLVASVVAIRIGRDEQ